MLQSGHLFPSEPYSVLFISFPFNPYDFPLLNMISLCWISIPFAKYYFPLLHIIFGFILFSHDNICILFPSLFILNIIPFALYIYINPLLHINSLGLLSFSLSTLYHFHLLHTTSLGSILFTISIYHFPLALSLFLLSIHIISLWSIPFPFAYNYFPRLYYYVSLSTLCIVYIAAIAPRLFTNYQKLYTHAGRYSSGNKRMKVR